MIKTLMCGPIAKSGGVYVHTKNLISNFETLGIRGSLYDLNGNEPNKLFGSINKVLRRTFGLYLVIIGQKDKYNLIHIQSSGGLFSFIAAITGCIASKKVNKKLVVTFHYSQTERFILKYKKLFRFLLVNVDSLILVSKSQEKVINDLFPCFSNKVSVIPNGYNSSLFYMMDMKTCRDQLGLSPDKKIIVNISNLTESKGHRYLIDAIKIIIESRDDISCYIIGDGYLKDELANYIKEIKLENFIKLIGWEPDEKLPIWLNACDVFAFPSIAESFGIVQLEAMACGKPVVATYNGGSENIIISENYGLLCKSKDSEILAKKINSALNKEWNFNKIREYSSQFTWENVAKSTLRVYTQLLYQK